MIVEFHARGACGFYSGAANFAPGAYVALERALDGGDAPRVTELEAQAMQLAARCADNPIPAIKAALAEALPGYPPHVRLPLEKYK